MATDPTSLERLHDIIVPPPTPWWPPAPGWLWLIALLALVVFAVTIHGLIRWQANRYRREALAELKRLAAPGSNPPASALAGMSQLLKRTALTAFPRSDVAALTGAEWFAFLDRTGDTNFSRGLGAQLEQSVYLGNNSATDPALGDEIRRWIRRHRSTA